MLFLIAQTQNTERKNAKNAKKTQPSTQHHFWKKQEKLPKNSQKCIFFGKNGAPLVLLLVPVLLQVVLPGGLAHSMHAD